METLVTGAQEHWASLAQRKNYRRLDKIEPKLAAGASSLHKFPRRRDFAADEAGRGVT